MQVYVYISKIECVHYLVAHYSCINEDIIIKSALYTRVPNSNIYASLASALNTHSIYLKYKFIIFVVSLYFRRCNIRTRY